MIRRRRLVLCSCCAVASSALHMASAQQAFGPFTQSQLQQAGATYITNISALFRQDLILRLPPARRSALAHTTLEFPAAELPSFPLAVWSYPETGLVVLPLRTVLFVQQYAGLCAYYVRKGCPLIQPLVYAKMLVARIESAGSRPPGPLEAFGLDEGIYSDEYVRDIANKDAKSTIFFLLAHELGHLYYHHRPLPAGNASIQQERQADAFALEAAAAIGVFPLGLAIYFLALSLMNGPQNSHPLDSNRLEALAEGVEARPAAFMDPSDDPSRFSPQVIEFARNLRRTASQIDNPDSRDKFERLAKLTDWPSLRADFSLLQKIGACHP
jgi:hypothetical protein